VGLAVVTNLSAKCQEVNSNIRNVGVEEGLSNPFILSIAEDKYGYFWLGSKDGINRFDGEKIVQYHGGDQLGLPSFIDVQNLYTDDGGDIWISCDKKYLLRYDYPDDRFILIKEFERNTTITHICSDKQGNLWVGTRTGLRILKKTEKGYDDAYLFVREKLSLGNIHISFVNRDQNAILWVGTINGLFRVNVADNDTLVSRYYYKDEDNLKLSKSFSGLEKVRDNHYWIAYTDRLEKIEANELQHEQGEYILRSNPVRIINPDKDVEQIRNLTYDQAGSLFLRSTNGVYRYDVETGSYRIILNDHIISYDTDMYGYTSNAFYYDTSNELLWAGTSKELSIINNRAERIKIISHNPYDPLSLSSNDLLRVLVDSRENLWVGTYGYGLNRGIKTCDPPGYSFERMLPDPTVFHTLKGEYIYTIQEPLPGRIFIADNSIQEAIVRDNRTTFISNPFALRIPDNLVNDTRLQFVFAEGFLWTLNFRYGTFLSDTLSGRSYNFYLNRNPVRFPATFLVRTGDNQYFIESSQGVIHRITFPLVPVDSTGFRPSAYEALNYSDSLKLITLFFLITNVEGKKYFWFRSFSEGVFKYQLFEPGQEFRGSMVDKPSLLLIKNYRKEDGLADNNIFDLIEDRKGRIWVTTLNGLSCLDPATEKFYNFHGADGFPGDKYYPGSCVDRDGNLYLCNTKGLVIFDPDSLISGYKSPEVVISQIRIFNKPYRIDNQSPAMPALKGCGEITLSHKENFLSFDISTLEYYKPGAIICKYRMDGIDDDWIDAGTNRTISYGTLRPGKYLLHIISSYKSGEPQSDQLTLSIRIRPPFYLTFWFLLLAVVTSVSLILIYIRFREKGLLARSAWLENEVREKTAELLKKRDEIDGMKTRFFTNISHEFRTPLTLINRSADELIDENDPGKRAGFISTIKRSSGRLLTLVNELLDLARMESGTLALKAGQIDITSEIRVICQNYISDADRRKIKIGFESVPGNISGWFDKEIINKIMQNLISNALKFTPESGKVRVSLAEVKGAGHRAQGTGEEKPCIKIEVADTGRGIPQEELSRIFERFYRVRNSDTPESEGTGIGLAIVEELVKRHYGSVKVESRLGKGTKFTVTIPSGKDHLATDELVTNRADMKSEGGDHFEYHSDPLSAKKSSGNSTLVTSAGMPLVLVVEDNDELRQFMVRILESAYRVVEASDGRAGFEKAEKLIPEIIISDIMMPGIDGLELCRKIKSCRVTDHIPLILLTAKADTASRIEGLKAGANDYLVKPFEKEELLVRMENLIMERQKLREKFAGSSLPDTFSLKKTGRGGEFLSSLLEMIESNLIRSDFSVEELSHLMNLSSRSLQRKLLALTGLNPVEFIRMVRIKFAARLITEKGAGISEAAYASGFSSLSYFSRVFKEVMGVTPTCYINK
jgi:signal transduction histidine kinase/DNA-binding response OmpR family regulator/ligand-binding sensor domain-containing protein